MKEPTPEEKNREEALVRAWDFVEGWQMRLTRPNASEKLDDFYAAMIKFLKREGWINL